MKKRAKIVRREPKGFLDHCTWGQFPSRVLAKGKKNKKNVKKGGGGKVTKKVSETIQKMYTQVTPKGKVAFGKAGETTIPSQKGHTKTQRGNGRLGEPVSAKSDFPLKKKKPKKKKKKKKKDLKSSSVPSIIQERTFTILPSIVFRRGKIDYL